MGPQLASSLSMGRYLGMEKWIPSLTSKYGRNEIYEIFLHLLSRGGQDSSHPSNIHTRSAEGASAG